MTYHLFGIEDLKARKSLAYVTGFEHLLTRHCDGGLLRVGVFSDLLKIYLLEVQDDVRDIFLYSGDGIKLMFHAVDFNCRDGITLERREQHTTKCVAHSSSVPICPSFPIVSGQNKRSCISLR